MLLLAAVLTFGATPARAEAALEVVQVGWDGSVVPGTWTPVRVRVTGGTADSNVRVEVILKGRFQSGPQTAPLEYPIGAYGQELALPAGVTKEVGIWVPADNAFGGNLSGAVRLTVGSQLVAEQRVELRGAKNPYWGLAGVLAEAPSVARALSRIELPMQGLPIPLNVVRLSAADLPARPERLTALSALVVQGNAATGLTGEQRRAVQEWVGTGGHLLLAGGPDASRTMAVLPPGVLPVSFTGTEAAADLFALLPWAEALGTAPVGPIARFRATGGSVLAGTAHRPLAWRIDLGRGTVTLLAADPSLEPLAGWDGTPALLRKALEPGLPNPGDNEKMRYMRYERDNPMRFQGAVEALPPEAFPDSRTVALILLGFALLVGPMLHLLLWRVDRRGLIWLAVPAAALLLSGALYYLGVGRAGRDVLVNIVSHLRLDPQTGQARQVLAAGFFAPTHPELAITVPGDAPVRPIGRTSYGPYGPGGMPVSPSTEPPFRLIVGRDTRVEFADQWSMRSMVLTRTLGQEVGRITSGLGLEGGLIRGTVRNDTPFPLEDAAVVVSQTVVKLGNLAPGQTAQVLLDPGAAPNPYQGGFPLSYRLFARTLTSGSGGMQVMYGPMPAPPPAPAVAAAPRSIVTTPPARTAAPSTGSPTPGPAASPLPTRTPTPAPTQPAAAPTTAPISLPSSPAGMPERLEIPQDPEVQRRVRLMDPAMMSEPRFGPGAPMMGLTFLAFTRAPAGKDMPTAGDHPTYYLTLLEQPLRLDLPPGPFTLPAALIPGEVLAQTGGFGGGSSGTVYWIQLQGSATYGFRPPLPAGARAEALLLTTQQVGPPTPWGPGKGGPPPGPGLAPGPAEEGLFSVYNWQSAAWDPLPGSQEQTRLEPAAPYLGPDGLVKLQITAPPERMVNVIMPELAVEGRVE